MLLHIKCPFSIFLTWVYFYKFRKNISVLVLLEWLIVTIIYYDKTSKSGWSILFFFLNIYVCVGIRTYTLSFFCFMLTKDYWTNNQILWGSLSRLFDSRIQSTYVWYSFCRKNIWSLLVNFIERSLVTWFCFDRNLKKKKKNLKIQQWTLRDERPPFERNIISSEETKVLCLVWTSTPSLPIVLLAWGSGSPKSRKRRRRNTPHEKSVSTFVSVDREGV